MGQPRRVKPRLVMGISGGRGEQEALAFSGMNSKDFVLLSLRPSDGPSDSMMLRVAAMSCGEPTKLPSSKYHAFRVRLGNTALMCSTLGWRVRVKPSGPRGSPCCTP